MDGRPQQRHAKRWQDIEELLAAGIEVWTTVNVQHLESLNDVVAGMTGVRQRETMPDRIFDQADDVELIDLPPNDLLTRLRAGKIYSVEHASPATKHYFREPNLLALRELALRRTADRVSAPGDLQRLFAKFYRGRAEGSAGGAGLGLSICRAIVTAHGGQIEATQRAGGGARFTFTLPVS